MRWLLVGDSHMQALGPRLQAIFGAAGAEEVIVEARPGRGVADFVDDLPALIARVRPDVVILELGANDGRWSTEEGASAFRARVARLVASAEGSGAQALWVGPPQATDPDAAARRPKVVAELLSVLPTLRVPFLDARPLTRSLPTRDGVHFLPAGYDVFAQGVAAWASQQHSKRKWWWLLGGAAVAGIGAGAWSLFARRRA